MRQIHRASVREVAPSTRVPPVGPGVSALLFETLTPYHTEDSDAVFSHFGNTQYLASQRRAASHIWPFPC